MRRFDPGLRLKLVSRVILFFVKAYIQIARVVELVYTADLKFAAVRHVGSTPTPGTTHKY